MGNMMRQMMNLDKTNSIIGMTGLMIMMLSACQKQPNQIQTQNNHDLDFTSQQVHNDDTDGKGIEKHITDAQIQAKEALTKEKLVLLQQEMEKDSQVQTLQVKDKHENLQTAAETQNVLSNNESPHQNMKQAELINTNASSDFIQSYQTASNIKSKHIPILYQAEQSAREPVRLVLKQARKMALNDREIIKGACWDYLNAVFLRAGVQRDTLFKGKYPKGPFADVGTIQAGDWLYYVNHSYHDIEHSGMFIGWVNRSKNEALILSYAGEHRQEPARYRVYDISHVYNIMRPVAKS